MKKEKIMATKKIYDECCRAMKNMRIRNLTSAGYTNTNTPDLVFLFGKKELVTKKEFMVCSKSEQRRHLCQDDILRSLYIKQKTATK